jgi:8-oxo-dGTP diphosphatase
VFIFKATEFSGNLITSSEGELHWIAKEKFFDLNLWEGDYIFLQWLDKREFFSAKFVYENRKLIDWQVTFYPVG